jgi:putative transposase
MDPLSYRRHRFPPPIIQHAIWLYLRFTLSYRDVEELLAERGLEVSYETVRRCVLKFGARVCAQASTVPPALSSMDAPCIASGSDELGRNVGLAVIYPALWRGR